MSTGTPRISVLMPVYDAERYVAEAVESILAQTDPEFEFIIIDDLTLSEGEANKPLSLTLELSTYYRLGANGT